MKERPATCQQADVRWRGRQHGGSGRVLDFSRRAILVLMLVNVVNFVDRQLPFVLIESIRADLHLSDSQIGLMAGVSFALVFSLASLPLAAAADRWSARGTLALCLTAWSAMTSLAGFAQGFATLLLPRAGVAASESGCVPAAHALIAHALPEERHARALALFSLGVPIGSMLGLGVGGWINDVAGWRVAFFLVGAPGLVLALLVWRLLPDARPAIASGTTQGRRHGHGAAALFRLRSFRHVAAGSALYACGSYATNVFAAAFLIRVHGFTAAQAGLGFGLAFGIGGLIGTYAGGALADRLGRRDPSWRQLVPAIGQFLALPVAVGAWLVPDPIAAICLIGLGYVFGLLYFAPSFAVAQSLAPPSMRAGAAAMLSLALTLVGSSVGPIAVGRISDWLKPTLGAQSLRYALCAMGVTILWSGIHFLLAARALPADLAAAARRA